MIRYFCYVKKFHNKKKNNKIPVSLIRFFAKKSTKFFCPFGKIPSVFQYDSKKAEDFSSASIANKQDQKTGAGVFLFSISKKMNSRQRR